MLSWTNQFNIFCFLDSCDYNIHPHHYDCLLATEATDWVGGTDLDEIDGFLQKGGWAFGHLSYELKDSIHHLNASSKVERIGFPPAFFFHPAILMQLKKNELTIHANDPDAIYEALIQIEITSAPIKAVEINQRLTKSEYLDKIRGLQKHILLGDCYEINFCQEFFAEEAEINPLEVYRALTLASPNPFSAFYRVNDQYLICASPERFITATNGKVVAQPMKGTIKRDLQNAENDLLLKQELEQSRKDRAENVMIVDLLRNDLTRICRDASVRVEELFGVYTYPQVHQMISTITGELSEELKFSDIIRATFPMGSMTGAPKHRVMQLIDEFEPTPRGIFSGTVGYIDPKGDFDFNVVIRSLMYNAASGYLSYQTGSGITHYSDPESEWEECLLKGQAIKKVLAGNQHSE